jgi:hypothetical protein
MTSCSGTIQPVAAGIPTHRIRHFRYAPRWKATGLYLRPPRAPRDLVQFAVELVGLVERAQLRAVVVRVPLARRVPRGLIDASPGDGVVRFDRFPCPRPMDGDPAVVLRSNTCPEKS